MTKFDEFLAKEGGVKFLHAKMQLPDRIKEMMNEAVGKALPQWVKDLQQNQEKESLIKGFVNGRLTALSIGKKEMLDGFAAKYGFEYTTAQNNTLINNLDKGRGR